MDKKIIFQKCNFNNIYFLCHIIASFIGLVIESTIHSSETDEIKSKYILPLQILIKLYITNLSNFIAIIPYLIMKRLVKKNKENIIDFKNEDNRITKNKTLIYNNYEKSMIKKKQSY